MTDRTCLKCGWVAFGVSRVYAEDEVNRFNEYFKTLDQEWKANFGGKPSSITLYERCFHCGGPHTNFRDALPGDAPDGVTMSPIIVE
jgi:hypothetical protein